MRQLKHLSLLLGLLLLGPSTYAQSVRFQSQAISSRGAGIANATVAVCTQPANTNTQPCSPLATLATSTSTTSGGANPLTADSFGNFFFYAAPGRYTVQIYGPAMSGQFVTPDVDILGTGTSNLSVAAKPLISDSVQYVSPNGNDSNDGLSPGTAKLTWQAAYNALPGTSSCLSNGGTCGGGVIQLEGGAQNFPATTLTVTNKQVVVRGRGAGTTYLNYSPTTATAAITIDITPAIGGQFTPAVLFEDFTLYNNFCQTIGGCGSSATGILLGPVNSGGAQSVFNRVKVEGFGTGINNQDAGGQGWGLHFSDVYLLHNTIGYQQLQPEEQVTFTTSKILQNGTGLNFAGSTNGGDFSFITGDIGGNTTCSVQTNSRVLVLNFENTHWETATAIANNFVCGGSAIVNFVGGTMMDDNNSGTTTTWFSAGQINAWGVSINTNGRSLAGGNFIFVGSNSSSVMAFDRNTAAIPLSAVTSNGSGVICGVNQSCLQLTSLNSVAAVTGTGACATSGSQTGGKYSGTFACTSATAASTVTLTFPVTAPNGWYCSMQDQTTRANILGETSNNGTTCTLTATSITLNDVIVFTANPF